MTRAWTRLEDRRLRRGAARGERAYELAALLGRPVRGVLAYAALHGLRVSNRKRPAPLPADLPTEDPLSPELREEITRARAMAPYCLPYKPRG